jgi:hypothetical protein
MPANVGILAGMARKKGRMRLTLHHSQSSPSGRPTMGGCHPDQRLTDHSSPSDLTNILPDETPVVVDRELYLRAGRRQTT